MLITDDYFMDIALRLAGRNLGQVWPNPAVGCVIVKNNRIIGRGWTAKGGRPHAESMALLQAGSDARGATIYVTLEPCSHQGQTPPCADSLIAAGIARVVVALGDPDPRVNGNGIARLKAAGIEVVENISRNEAQKLNQGFLSRIINHRPTVTLKLATSLDGKIALGNGDSRWITNDQSRRYGHLLRSQHDAILTGINTVLADDPVLNCRLPGMDHKSPLRVVMDRQLRIVRENKIVKTTSEYPLWIYTESSDQEKINQLQKAGAQIFVLDELSIQNCFTHLAGQGITRLLVEAGSKLSTAFLQSGFVDNIVWFRAAKIIGQDGLAALGALNYQTLKQAEQFKLTRSLLFGDDRCDILVRES